MKRIAEQLPPEVVEQANRTRDKHEQAALEEQNLHLWNRVCETDPEFTDPVRRGAYTFTAIDAMWQVRQATALWGPIGGDWGYRASYGFLEGCGTDSGLAYADVVLWYPGSDGKECQFGPVRAACRIVSAKSGHMDDEAWKKAATNGLTKLLSQLGFSADVFLGQFEDNNYVDKQAERFRLRRLPARVRVTCEEYIPRLKQALKDNDALGGVQLINEVREIEDDNETWIALWQFFNTKERAAMREWKNPDGNAAA